jgi:hypothetical protein
VVATSARIQTTVVGSYPLPAWLAALPNAVHLRDPILVVLKAQELVGDHAKGLELELASVGLSRHRDSRLSESAPFTACPPSLGEAQKRNMLPLPFFY